MWNNPVGIDYKPLDISLFKRLLIYLKPYWKYVLITLIVTLSTSSLAPLRSYLMKVAIDNNIAKSDWIGLYKMAIFIFALLIIHGLFQFIFSYMMQWVGQKVLYDIRIKLFEHIHSLSLKFFDKNPVGRLVTRVTNDIEVLNDLFSSGLVSVISDFLLLFWIIGFMFYTDVRLALISLLILPLIILISILFKNRIRVLFREIRLQVAKMNAFLNEFISGITTIRIFSQEERQNEIFGQINKDATDLQLKSIFFYAMFFPFVEFLSFLGLAIIIWYSAGNIFSGKMTVGILIAFAQYIELLFRPIRDLTEKYTTLQSAMASSERIFGLLDTQEFLQDSSNAITTESLKESIEFRNVNFSYDGEKEVLRDVSFTINKGESLAIVGATGSGKTSIINLLLRFYEHQEGSILIDGIDLKKIKQNSLRKSIALVMQDVFLFSGTISENITLGRESISIDKIKSAAEEMGAIDFINKLTNNFDSDIMERGSTLSAGQRQLLQFCRAYASNPEILILDEASSNIDSESERIIELSLKKLLEGRTSIIIAHRLSTIKNATKIIVLHHGKIRETGSHNQLLEKNGLYAKLYKLQFNKI
jgi:ATP-binding cassette, subfamily B, multidrug efflux pump